VAAAESKAATAVPEPAPADLSALTSMLSAKWKHGEAASSPKREQVRAGQIRSFRILRLDPAQKKIELELAS
jgi:small subunit ribosomal protein S1